MWNVQEDWSNLIHPTLSTHSQSNGPIEGPSNGRNGGTTAASAATPTVHVFNVLLLPIAVSTCYV